MSLLALAALSAWASTVPGEHDLAAAVRAAPAGAVIQLGPGVWTGPVDIEVDLELRGAGARQTLLHGARDNQILRVRAGATLTLRDVTIDANGRHGVRVEAGSGLTLEDAVCTGGSAVSWPGGCLSGTGAELVVRRTRFLDNQARGQRGGHIGATGGALTVEDSELTGGRAERGGGLYAAGGARVTLLRASFGDNASTADGGAVCLEDPGEVDIRGSWFFDNRATHGGGLYLEDARASVLVADSIFARNESGLDGGGAMLVGPSESMRVQSSIFQENTSGDDGSGLALASAPGAVVQDAWFEGGVALDDGGAMHILDSQGAAVRASAFYRNRASDNGGAIQWIRGSNGEVSGSLMCGNQAEQEGGALQLDEWHGLTVSHTVLAHNDAGTTGGAVHAELSTALFVAHTDLLDNGANRGAHLHVTGAKAELSSNVLAYGRGAPALDGDLGAFFSGYDLFFDNPIAGADGVVLAYGAEVADPRYTTYEPGADCADIDLRPLPGSPLIDGGDPGAPPDVDGSPADRGSLGGGTRWREDRDGDGFVGAADCHDGDARLNPATIWYFDADRDGYGDPATATVQCVPPGVGWILVGGDCDDGDPAIHPGAPEVADNGIDEDCDGVDGRTWLAGGGGCGCAADPSGRGWPWIVALALLGRRRRGRGLTRRRPAPEALRRRRPA